MRATCILGIKRSTLSIAQYGAPVMVIIQHRYKFLVYENSTLTGIGNFGSFGAQYEHIALFVTLHITNSNNEERPIAGITIHERLTCCCRVSILITTFP